MYNIFSNPAANRGSRAKDMKIITGRHSIKVFRGAYENSVAAFTQIFSLNSQQKSSPNSCHQIKTIRQGAKNIIHIMFFQSNAGGQN